MANAGQRAQGPGVWSVINREVKEGGLEWILIEGGDGRLGQPERGPL